MKKYFLLWVLLTLTSFGCTSEPVGKVRAADAIQVVQDSESYYSGAKTAEAIAGLLKVMQSRGASVEVVGWTQDYKSGGTHDVWFKVKTDNSMSEFHWVISPDGMINPVNQLAQNVMKAQMAQ